MHFSASKFKKIRLSKGYTQKALAEKLGLSQQNINAWEKSKYVPKPDVLKKIAKVLNLTIEDFTDSISIDDIISKLPSDLKLLVSSFQKLNDSDKIETLNFIIKKLP